MLPFLFDKLRERWIISTVCSLAFMGSLLPWATAQDSWWTKWTNYPDFLDVFFIDQKRGWVVGFNGIIATQDGGANWQVQFDSTVPPFGSSIAVIDKVFFLDEQEGWAIARGPVETGLLFHTTDGGENWDKEVDASFIPEDIQFVNRNEGWMTKKCALCIGEHGVSQKILHTSDGGLTWREQFRCVGICGDFGPLFFLNKVGWFASGGPILYHTTDGGATWDSVEVLLNTLVQYQWIDDLFFLNEQEGWAVTHGFIIHTVDGGHIWEIQEERQDVQFREIYFAGSHGWAIGEIRIQAEVGVLFLRIPKPRGIILHTEDGGKSWQTQLETPCGLQGIHFFNPLEGWIIGSSLMLRTQNGGISWEIYTPEGITKAVSPIGKMTTTWGEIKSEK